MGFVEAKSDTSLFIYKQGQDTVYLLLYVDDIMLTASSSSLLCCTIVALQQEFSMKDLGPLHHFLGISVSWRPDGLFMSQRQYILDILDRAVMSDCKPCSTPVDTHAKVFAAVRMVLLLVMLLIIGVLLAPYSMLPLPGLTSPMLFSKSLHMHDPRKPHLSAVKRILRYLVDLRL